VAAWGGTVAFSLVFAVGLFFLLPVGITSIFRHHIGNSIEFVLIEKAIRISIFVGYLWGISRIAELQRVFEYHGAEHKTISCYEAGLPLTPENAQRFSRLHPRCRTRFLLIGMGVARFVFASRILGIPIVAGIAFEIIKLFGKYRSKRWAQIAMWPGMQLQKLTTRPPSLDQLEVAIASMEAVLSVENPEEASDEDRVGMEV